CARWGALDYW
nr:immunoglobulin heavy chain junction region [Mus musculus]